MAGIIHLLDIDGTMCPKQYTNPDRVNDNGLFRSPAFEAKLASAPVYPWVMRELRAKATSGDIFIIITGRLREHEDVTIAWFKTHVRVNPFFFSVEWNDRVGTWEQSASDYVTRKIAKIDEFIHEYTRRGFKVRVYEDDLAVLSAIHDKYKGNHGEYLKILAVDERGTLYRYGAEKHA